MRLKGKTTIITGAAGGIGRAIAVSLARRGCHLAICDINEAGLAETAQLTAAHGVKVTQHRLDVSDRKAIAAFPNDVTSSHPAIDILVNNAGVAINGTFEQASEEDFEWLFDINFWGVVRMTRAFLPILKSRPEAQIVNLSSVFGLIAPPGQTAYSASKFAVRGFSNALRHELEMENSNVGVTVVHPGGVATSIADNARVPEGISQEEVRRQRAVARELLKLPPETAGEVIVQAIEQRAPRVLVGDDARKLAFLERLFPITYWNIIKRRHDKVLARMAKQAKAA